MVAGGAIAMAACMVAFVWLPAPAVWCLIGGIVVGAAPGPAMSLLPRVVSQERLSSALGVYYSVLYAGAAILQPLAGLFLDLSGWPVAPQSPLRSAVAAPPGPCVLPDLARRGPAPARGSPGSGTHRGTTRAGSLPGPRCDPGRLEKATVEGTEDSSTQLAARSCAERFWNTMISRRCKGGGRHPTR